MQLGTLSKEKVGGRSTRLWDAVDKAADAILALNGKRVFPNARQRIIVITDGEDNASTIKPSELCRKLVANDIVVDAVVLSKATPRDQEPKRNLPAQLSVLTGGIAFLRVLPRGCRSKAKFCPVHPKDAT